MKKQLTLKITGLVQGVGFRYSARNKARDLGFTGYVSNTEDGAVDLVAEGEEEALKDFTTWCYNGVGPAVVYTIDQSWSEATGDFDNFVIKS